MCYVYTTSSVKLLAHTSFHTPSLFLSLTHTHPHTHTHTHPPTHTHTHTRTPTHSHTQILVGSSLGGWLMFLYTLRNPDKVCGLVGIATAADHTQRVWKGLEKEKKVEVQRSGVYDMPNEYGTDPIPLSMELFHDGEKYSILDTPGTIYYVYTYTHMLMTSCLIGRGVPAISRHVTVNGAAWPWMKCMYIRMYITLPCTLSLFKTVRLDITHKMYSSEVQCMYTHVENDIQCHLHRKFHCLQTSFACCFFSV